MPSYKDTLMELLLNFRPEFAYLSEFVKVANGVYGEEWQLFLERDVNAMPARLRNEYLPRLKVALAYDNAVRLWRRAEQVLAGSLPASLDAVGDIEEFDKALPRFGKFGEQMLVRLRLKLGLPPIAGTRTVIPVRDTGIQVKKTKTTPATKIKIKKTVLARKKKEAATPRPLPVHSRPLPVHSRESGNPAPKKSSNIKDALDSRMHGNVRLKVDWNEALFERLEEFVAESREIMAMLVLDGKYSSLEEYPYYGFIVDATRVLSEKAAELGMTEKSRLYKKALENEIVPERASTAPTPKKKTVKTPRPARGGFDTKPLLQSTRRATLQQPKKKLAKPKKKS